MLIWSVSEGDSDDLSAGDSESLFGELEQLREVEESSCCSVWPEAVDSWGCCSDGCCCDEDDAGSRGEFSGSLAADLNLVGKEDLRRDFVTTVSFL